MLRSENLDLGHFFLAGLVRRFRDLFHRRRKIKTHALVD